jgi:hypothetical protein
MALPRRFWKRRHEGRVPVFSHFCRVICFLKQRLPQRIHSPGTASDDQKSLILMGCIDFPPPDDEIQTSDPV